MKDLNDKIKLIKKIWRERPLVGSFVIFFLVFLLCSSVCFVSSGYLFPDDHFFHFKYAYLLRTRGFDINNHFNWIYLSEYVKNGLPYKTSLFQIALIPFTFIKNLRTGLQVSDIFWASSSLSIIYYAFRKLKIDHAFLLTLFLIAPSFFMTRFLAGRALVLATGMLFLLIYFAIAKKYYKFFFISVIYIFWHQTTFFMPFFIAVIVETGRYMSFKKINPQGIIGGIVSIFLAALYFSFSSFFDMSSFFKNVASQAILGEGVEIYKKDIFQIIGFSEVFLFTLLLSFAFVFYAYSSNRNVSNGKRPQSLLNIYVAFLFLLMSLAGSIFASGRFLDYYGVGVIFLAGSCISYLKQEKYTIEGNLSKFLIGGVLFFLLIIGTNTFINIKKTTYLSDIAPIKLVSEWIGSKSSDGDKVYTYNWSDFTIAFFYNDKNIYSMGIEPMALKKYDEKLYWKWNSVFNYGIYCDKEESCVDQSEKYQESIKNADEKQKELIIKENGRKIVESIKNDFNAKYVIVSGENNPVALNEGLISDSFSAKSEINGSTMWAYELK